MLADTVHDAKVPSQKVTTSLVPHSVVRYACLVPEDTVHDAKVSSEKVTTSLVRLVLYCLKTVLVAEVHN